MKLQRAQDVDPTAEKIIRILRKRDHVPTAVELADGRHLLVFNIAWGLDLGDTHYHVTTNISPVPGDGIPADFFFTHEVVCLSDPDTGAEIFRP